MMSLRARLSIVGNGVMIVESGCVGCEPVIINTTEQAPVTARVMLNAAICSKGCCFDGRRSLPKCISDEEISQARTRSSVMSTFFRSLGRS